MAKFPYLSGRKGSGNLYYKRMVPLELRSAGRPAQIWRSLRTADRRRAERAHAATHAEIELLFAQRRK